MEIRSKHPLSFRWLAALALTLALPVLSGDSCLAQQPTKAKGDFPRLLGMNIGEQRYADPAYQRALARMDVVILGFYPQWNGHGPKKMSKRDVVKLLKTLNPNLLVGQYTVLNETQPFSEVRFAENDRAAKATKEGWWLLDSRGNKVQWTPEWGTWDINISTSTKPDAQGKRYSEWVAERDYQLYFSTIPELEIWYLDNVFPSTRVKEADWKRTGTNMRNDDPEVARMFRDGQVRHWDAIRKLKPGIMLMGNSVIDAVSSEQYRNKLNGVFLEGCMGQSWSIETRQGWAKMMQQLASVSAYLLPPQIVGFNVWGESSDFRFFRYALTSCLMEDAYFSFTDKKGKYGTTPLFDEYNVPLGKAQEPPVRKPSPQGVYMRAFERGLAIVNPGTSTVTVDVPKGYATFRGVQAPSVNTGQPVTRVTLPSKDGIVLVRQTPARS